MIVLKYILEFIKKVILTIVLLPFSLVLTVLLETESVFLLIYYIWVKPDKFREEWEKLKEKIKVKTKNQK